MRIALLRMAAVAFFVWLNLGAIGGPIRSAGATAGGPTQPAQTSGPSVAVPDKALMQRIWDAWSTLDPSRAAVFYQKSPDNVYFDLTPLKYIGWQNYAAGVDSVAKQFQSAKFKVNDDAKIQNSPNAALGTATIDAELTHHNAAPQHLTLRWTVVWAREGENWLIMHEHISAPLNGL